MHTESLQYFTLIIHTIMDNQNLPPYPPQIPPGNNLVWAILTTIFCCLPFGIVAIVYAAKVDGLWAAGDYGAAYESSRKAKNWSIIAAAVGGLAIIVYVILICVGFSFAGMQELQGH